jgi:hypothetical protein
VRKSVMLTCVLVLGSAGASGAEPLDSPGMAYIDGLPCNSLCLSYLAWSHRMSSTPKLGRRFAIVPPGTRMREARSGPAAQSRVANVKQVTPSSDQVARAGIADLQPAANAVAVFEKTATNIADPHREAASDAGSNFRTTIHEQVAAATAAAMHAMATAVPAPEQKASHTGASDHPEAVLPADAHHAAAAPANDTDLLIVLVMARPEIKSVSDLASKTIAIDDAQSASIGDVRAAIVAAGAPEVQLTGDQTKAIDRLTSGAVPAAVLAVVSPEAALRFPEVQGFRIFQVLLLHRSLKAAADMPEAK